MANAFQNRNKEAYSEGCEPVKLLIEECKELILALLEGNPATIIIDALDECDPFRKHELLKALDEIIQESASLVKIFVSSRNDNDIRYRLSISPNIVIYASRNEGDIDRFVHSEVHQAIQDKRLLRGQVSMELKNQITTTLLQGAQGMSVYRKPKRYSGCWADLNRFRWVSL